MGGVQKCLYPWASRDAFALKKSHLLKEALKCFCLNMDVLLLHFNVSEVQSMASLQILSENTLLFLFLCVISFLFFL